MRIAVPLLLTVLLALGGCASSGLHVQTIDLMDAGPTKTVAVSTGHSLDIALAENPSTGWTWKLQSPLDGILRSSGDRFVRDAAGDGMVGVGGKRVFTYTAIKPGQVSLEFALVGPGQPLKPSDQRMMVTINVTE